ncbi:unnamed protein product, partial [Choristocarpus tenellus]
PCLAVASSSRLDSGGIVGFGHSTVGGFARTGSGVVDGRRGEPGSSVGMASVMVAGGRPAGGAPGVEGVVGGGAGMSETRFVEGMSTLQGSSYQSQQQSFSQSRAGLSRGGAIPDTGNGYSGQ